MPRRPELLFNTTIHIECGRHQDQTNGTIGIDLIINDRLTNKMKYIYIYNLKYSYESGVHESRLSVTRSQVSDKYDWMLDLMLATHCHRGLLVPAH